MKNRNNLFCIICILMMTSCVRELQQDGDCELSFRLSVESSRTDLPVKSMPLTEVPDSVSVFGYRYAEWGPDMPPTLMDGALLLRRGSNWIPEFPVLGDTGNSKCRMRFYALAPSSSPGVESVRTAGGLSVDYRVPEKAVEQSDLIYGISPECTGDMRSIDLMFRHVLSCVTFSVSDQCSDARLTSLKIKNIYTAASLDPSGSWNMLHEKGTRCLDLSHDVVSGTSSQLSGGNSSMMLIPQILPEDAVLEVTAETDRGTVVLETAIGGSEWKSSCRYDYVLTFDADPYDSSVTYEINMKHKTLYDTPKTQLELPNMRFASGTRSISIDWGDGTVEKYSSNPDHKYLHTFPSDYVGTVVVKIKGESPTFFSSATAQKIRKVVIEGNERYDSRDGCNCIIETSTGRLCYAGSAYHIPDGVKTIGMLSMVAVEDVDIVIPEGVVRLEYGAFSAPSAYVQTVSLPASLTDIEDGAFCSYTTYYLKVSPSNPKYDSRNNCNCIMETASDYVVVSSKNSVYPQETKGIRPYGMVTSPTTVVLPASCLDICNYAAKCNVSIKYLVLPKGCRLGNEAFSSCLMKEVDISAGDITVGAGAFSYATGVTELDLNKVTLKSSEAFLSHKSLKSVIIPENCFIPNSSFKNCTSLTSLNIPKGCTIGASAFFGSGIVTLHIASTPGYTNHSNRTFAYCYSLTEVNTYDGLDSFEKMDFQGCPVTRFNIFNSEPPSLFNFNLKMEGGEVHVRTEIGFYGWFNQSVFAGNNWKMVCDL